MCVAVSGDRSWVTFSVSSPLCPGHVIAAVLVSVREMVVGSYWTGGRREWVVSGGVKITGVQTSRSKMENEQKLNVKWAKVKWFFLVVENIQHAVILVKGGE